MLIYLRTAGTQNVPQTQFLVSNSSGTLAPLATKLSLIKSRSKVLLEKLTGSQLVKKFPSYYGTASFITAFTSACHLSLS
jgi:hypothetical protein